jgi:hypothetical protein
MSFANGWLLAGVVCIAGSTTNAQMINGIPDPMWARSTTVTRMVGLNPMGRRSSGTTPARELRLYIEESFNVPYEFLRIVDSGRTTRVQRGIWWDGRYFDPVHLGDDWDTTGALRDDPQWYAKRRAFVLGVGCDSIRVRPRVEACLLRPVSVDARSLLASLDSLGVFHLPAPDARAIAPDGWSIGIETWDGRHYQWTWINNPAATSSEPHVRAAAEIARRMKALFADAPSRRVR